MKICSHRNNLKKSEGVHLMMLAVDAVTLPWATGEQVQCREEKVFRRIYFSSENL